MIPILLSGLNFWLLSRETRPSTSCSGSAWSCFSGLLHQQFWSFSCTTRGPDSRSWPLVSCVSCSGTKSCFLWFTLCLGTRSWPIWTPALVLFLISWFAVTSSFFSPSDLLLPVAVQGFEPLIFYLLFSHRVLLLCLSTRSRPALRHTFSSRTTSNSVWSWSSTSCISYLLFWYQVLTWVSLSCSEAASSIRSWTLRYFCFWKLLSSLDSCWSLNAVRALRGFFRRAALCSEAPPGTVGWLTGRN